jgi:hypothetical protein
MGSVRLVDSAEETAKGIESELKKGVLTRKKATPFTVSLSPMLPSDSSRSAGRFLGEKVESAVRIER